MGSTMLDELRNRPEDEFDFDDDDNVIDASDDREKSDRLFLGMTAVERMFISIFLFMNVVILGLAFLLATRRIVF
jgi:hypothetical protein